MAKYFIEETTLKNMADTIRSLTGSTATLTPGQMVNEVQVAENNIDEVMNVIESLGVEIPEGSDIGDLADLVGNIEAGTGDSSGGTSNAGEWIWITSLPTTYAVVGPPSSGILTTYYYEVPENCKAVVINIDGGYCTISYKAFSNIFSTTSLTDASGKIADISDADSTGTILKIDVHDGHDNSIRLLPIYGTQGRSDV